LEKNAASHVPQQGKVAATLSGADSTRVAVRQPVRSHTAASKVWVHS
jgi:hypothetical protein